MPETRKTSDEPGPAKTGKRRQQTRSGFKSEKEAWKECRTAIADYERGQPVAASRRKVAAAFEEWLTRIEHWIKPSMALVFPSFVVSEEPGLPG